MFAHLRRSRRKGISYARSQHKSEIIRAAIETLETRQLLSVSVLTYHNDIASTGVNSAESTISPANVSVGSFGKWFAAPVDGQVYAQPLVDAGVNITAGPNTMTGSTGTHDIVLVATEHDSLYAIDATFGANGAVLWRRSFTSIASGYVGSAAGTNINSTLGATAIGTLSTADTGSSDISPEIGITGTPVIDGTKNIAYLVVKTKEVIGGYSHYVQRLHAINLGNGTDTVTPYLVGDTTNKTVNNTSIYVYGNGDGSVVDPYNNTGKNVVQFNALREHQRSALSLVNNELYVPWASHGDNGPYHGWVAKWNVSSISSSGFKLSGVFNTTPNGGLGGIWMGAGRLAFESNGSAFYFETGNGPSGHATQAFNSNGFPSDGNYYESLVKVVADTTTSATNQNINGWGLKAADFFIPYNQGALDSTDQDFGSGAPILLPDSAGISGHAHLMLAAGKQGKIYVVDRDNLGKFNSVNDNVINAVQSSSGHLTPPVQLGGALSTAAYYKGAIYWSGGYSAPAIRFTMNSNGALTAASQTAATLGYLPGSVSISANGTSGGIAWVMDRNTNVIHAYDAATFSNELWNSGQKAGGADNLGAVVKFAVPTIANGAAYVGTTDSLVVYGLTPPAATAPGAPVLSASPLSGSSINLSWTDSTQNPNTATGYIIEQLINGTYTQVATAPGGSTSLSIGGLAANTAYSFRILGYNGVGNSAYSNVATATTSNSVAVLDFSGGFANSTAKLKYNGSAAISGSNARLTSGVKTQAGSVFSLNTVDVSKFQTQFKFQTQPSGTKADGFTFTIQGVGSTALGSNGGGLGYATDGKTTGPVIDKSVAIKFDLYSNAGEGNNSTGLFTNGAAPTKPAITLGGTGVNLQSSDVFQVTMNYDGTTLTVTIADTATGATATQKYAVNIPSIVGETVAFVGFTGGSGSITATQDIQNWTYTPSTAATPAAPSALGAAVASATSVTLNWTNNATNQTGFALDRATDADFLNNLVTQNIAASPNNYTDTYTGLAPGGTYYYRLRATNSAGPSGYSNVVTVTVPLAPAKPSDAAVTAVTASTISLSWTDNAGRTADGYRILRSVDHGTYDDYVTLPALNATPPAPYTWDDTGVSAGHYYSYHIQAFNVSGYNDFAGTNATALPAAPSSLIATPTNGSVGLSWAASFGALSYNVYRGTSTGGENATPLATNVTTTSYTDQSVTEGTKYDYFVTALVGNTPPLPSEGAPSNEVSVTPGTSVNLPVYDFNFTTAGGENVTNFMNDSGAAWGVKSSGLTYGWNIDNSAQTRDRDSTKSVDELHDSLAHMQKPGNPDAWWGVALGNGTYSVRIMVGDPSAYDSVYKLNLSDGSYADGTLQTFSPVLAINATPSGRQFWAEATVTVTVTHGGLFVTNAAGSSNNKIDAIQITQIS